MSVSHRFNLITFCILLIAAATATAATHVVRQDGSGDFTTIGDAVDYAGDGDLILVGAGTYDEYLEIRTDLDLRAEVDATSTILDGGDSHRIMVVDDGAAVTIEGFTFTGALEDLETSHGVALLVWHGSQADVADCLFIDNYSGWDNGAIHANGAGTEVTVSNSRFEGNRSFHNGGACGVATGAVLTMTGCEFRDNWCASITGAVNAWYAQSLNLYDCLFVGNISAVSAVIVEQSAAEIVGNTFHANNATEHASVLFYTGSSGVFLQNIVSGDTGGAGLKHLGGSSTHGCNVYDDNYLGPVEGTTLQPDEFAQAVLFCDPDGGDFTLCADSPALEVNNGCGLMGAYGEGCGACGVVAVEARSWSQVKDMYR